VQFTPGYNCADRGMRGHGVHGMEIRWLLRGPAGAAQFLLYSDWIPGQLSPGHGLMPDGSYSWQSVRGDPLYPMGADVGYHARRPQFDGQDPMSDECIVLGGPCYYDGSGMRADKLTKVFVQFGEQAVWDELESVYADLVREEEEAARATARGQVKGGSDGGAE
jgi:hypothetical protein